MQDGTAHDLAGLLGEHVSGMNRLGGGDVAEAFQVILAGGQIVFAKTLRRPPPGFFTTEAAGLAWLREAHSLPLPRTSSPSATEPAGPRRGSCWSGSPNHATPLPMTLRSGEHSWRFTA